MTSASTPEYIFHRYGSNHAVWFSASKSFVSLAGPAWDVLRLYTGNADIGAIEAHCNRHYGRLEGNIPEFVSEIICHIRHLADPRNATSLSQKHLLKKASWNNTFLQTVTYCAGGTSFRIMYADKNLKFFVHPLLAHLETTETRKKAPTVECLSANGLLAYRYRGELIEAFAPENSDYFTGGFRQLLCSILYNKSYTGWMMTLHASGVVKNGQALLFSAAAGSGKSTVSALLKAHGYGYLADDFIAADENGQVYPFPAAISVKEGAAKVLSGFYPELQETNPERAHTGKQVRYLPVHNPGEIRQAPYPVTALVFVRFSPAGPCSLEEVEKKDALQLLLKETWVNPDAANVARFFAWVEKTRFYSLRYSTTAGALEAAERLFAS